MIIEYSNKYGNYTAYFHGMRTYGNTSLEAIERMLCNIFYWDRL